MGDAALSFDPLSSMGIPNAMHPGIRAAPAIHAAISGNQQAVSAYEEHVRKISPPTCFTGVRCTRWRGAGRTHHSGCHAAITSSDPIRRDATKLPVIIVG